MTGRISTIALLGFAGLSAACGSDDDPGASTPTAGAGGSSATGGSSASGGTGGSTAGSGGTGGTAGAAPPAPTCTSGDNATCQPSGFSFAQAAFAHSNGCQGICDPALASGAAVHFTQPESGKLCMSGNLDATETGIGLDFTVFSSESTDEVGKILSLFNADLHDITQVRFTIDDPPPGGVLVAADTMHSLECHGIDCITWGAPLATPVTESGVAITVALDDFLTQAGQTIDTRAFGALRFDVAPGAFDYCLRDFDFLDADGNEVGPP